MQSLSRSTEGMIRHWIYEEERRVETASRQIHTLRVTKPAPGAPVHEMPMFSVRKAA